MRLGVIATIGRDWKADVERVRIAEDLGDEHTLVELGGIDSQKPVRGVHLDG